MAFYPSHNMLSEVDYVASKMKYCLKLILPKTEIPIKLSSNILQNNSGFNKH